MALFMIWDRMTKKVEYECTTKFNQMDKNQSFAWLKLLVAFFVKYHFGPYYTECKGNTVTQI